MSQPSKLMAGRIIIDYQSLITYILDYISSHKSRNLKYIKENKQKLELVKKDLKTIREVGQLEDFGFEPKYERLSKIVEEIEQKNYSSESELREMLEKARRFSRAVI